MRTNIILICSFLFLFVQFCAAQTNVYSYGILPIEGNNLVKDFNYSHSSDLPKTRHDFLSYSNITWGDETNHFSAGLLVKYLPENHSKKILLYPLVRASSLGTNYDYSWTLMIVPEKYRYKINLRDKNGVVLPKKMLFGKTDPQFNFKIGSIDRQHGFIKCFAGSAPQINIIPTPVILEDYFLITNTGKYLLEFELLAVKKSFSARTAEEYRLPVVVDIQLK